MITFHRLQGSLVIYFKFFTFLFILTKIDIYPYIKLYYKSSYKFIIHGMSQNYSCSEWDRVFIF